MQLLAAGPEGAHHGRRAHPAANRTRLHGGGDEAGRGEEDAAQELRERAARRPDRDGPGAGGRARLRPSRQRRRRRDHRVSARTVGPLPCEAAALRIAPIRRRARDQAGVRRPRRRDGDRQHGRGAARRQRTRLRQADEGGGVPGAWPWRPGRASHSRRTRRPAS